MDANLLHRYVAGDVSEQEALEVAAWIAESNKNEHQYKVYRSLYDIALWRTEEAEVFLQKKNYGILSKSLMIKMCRIAAIVLVVFSLTYWWARGKGDIAPAIQTVHTPKGQRTEMLLSDGTKVWINSNSTLKYSDFTSQDRRVVELDGEGYFIVTKNPAKPFIVKTSRYDIKVLGTEFNVTAYSSTRDWHASLINGKIDIDAKDGSNLMVLEPNTEAYVENGNLMKRSMNTIESAFKWRRGQISFENRSMTEIIRKLEACYDVKIIVYNKRILQSRYTGTFAVHDGISHILDVLSAYDKFAYTLENDNKIIIY